MDREIKYVLTGDASKLKSELSAIQKQAEEVGKSMDRALTKAFKQSTAQATEQIARNMELIKRAMPTGTDFNNVEKGFNNAFNTKSLANYAKEQSNIATGLQRMDGQYKSLQANADAYSKTLQKSGVDAATTASITTTWLNNQRQALLDNARASGSAIGDQFGGISKLAPTLALALSKMDDEAAEVQRQLDSAAASADKFINQIKGAFGKSARNEISAGSRAILGFGESIRQSTHDLTRLGFGLAAAFAAFATMPLLKTITQIEQAQLGLESLLGSAEQAGAAIYRIYEFANQTAFPTADLIAYEQKLVSVGLSGEQAFGVIARVSDIGGAFGATSDQLDRFYYVLSQIFGAGRAMGTDFLQIQNSLPGFISAIGKAMGKSAGEVRGAFGDGSVTSQVIADALNILTEEGGKAFQGAARQSSTLGGMMNNLVDNLKRVGMAFFGVRITMEGLDPVVGGIYERLKKLVETILAFAENPLAVKAFELMGSAMAGALAVLERFPQVIAVAAGLFISFATDIIQRIPFIGNLIGGISYQVGLLVGLFGAMVTASSHLRNALVTVVAQFLNFLNANSGLFESLLMNFKNLLATIGEGVAPAMIILTQIFLNFVSVVLNVINFLVAMANTIASFLGPELTRAITLTITFMTVALALAPVINSVIGAIVGLQVAMASLAFRITIVIGVIVALMGLLFGLFGQKPQTKSIDLLSGIFDDIGKSAAPAASGIDKTTESITDAGKAAAKAAKQLAAFDKMNVINSPTGADDAGAGSPGGISGLTPPVIPEPDFKGMVDKFKKMFTDIEDSIPKFSWLDFVVPAVVFAGLFALSKLLSGIKWAKVFSGLSETFGMLWINIQIFFAKVWKALLGFVTKVPIWGWALAAAIAVALLIAFNWDKVAPLLDKLGEMVGQALDTVVKVFNDIAPKIPGIITKVVETVFSVLGKLTEAAPVVIDAGAKIVIGFIGSITKALPGIVKVGLDIMVTLLKAIVNAIPEILKVGVTIIGVLVKAIAMSIQLIATVAVSIIKALIDVFIASLPLLFTAGLQIIMVLVNAIIGALPIIMQSAVTILSTIVQAITDNLPIILNAAITIIMALVDGIIGMLPTIIQTVITLIITIATAIIDNLPAIIDAAVNLIITLAGALIDNLPTIIDAAITLILTLALALIDNLPTIIDAAIKLVIALATALINNLPKLIDAAIRLVIALAKGLIDNLPKLISAAIQIIVALAKGLWDNREKILKAMADIATNIAGKLGEIDWGKIGKDLIQGLWNGINNMGNWIGEKIKGFGKGVTDSLKKFFGIKSPSRLMRDEVGKMLGEGIGVGITQSTASAVSAAQKSAQSIGQALSSIDTGPAVDISKQYITGVSQALSTSGEAISSFVNGSTGSSTQTSSDSLSNGPGWVEDLVSRLGVNDKDEPTVVNVYLDGNKIGGAVSSSINNRSMVTGVNQIYV